MSCHVFVYSHLNSAFPVLFCLLCLTTSCQVSLLCDYLSYPDVLHRCLPSPSVFSLRAPCFLCRFRLRPRYKRSGILLLV